jgi:hypothetical protein
LSETNEEIVEAPLSCSSRTKLKKGGALTVKMMNSSCWGGSVLY